MLRIEKITHIDKRYIALLDTSSISFMQKLQENGIKTDSILKIYDLILIPQWVLTEIEDAIGRTEYVQTLIDAGYPIYCIAEESYSELTGYEEGNLYQIVLASTCLILLIWKNMEHGLISFTMNGLSPETFYRTGEKKRKMPEKYP